jgi:triphosphoribosyl-dephospho-CoA synthase
MSGLEPEVVAEAYREACLDELKALKPGNVHVYADGHRMRVHDFEQSADASGPALAAKGARVGERVLRSVQATLERVGTNTNLGIVLLCAPLAAAAECEGDLFAELSRVLSSLDRQDAAAVYEAIRLASPAGLGQVADHDVRSAPTINLRLAMEAAAGHDRIAYAYITGFRDVTTVGLPALAEARQSRYSSRWCTTAVYLAFLSAGPDTHIQRKFGRAEAEAVRARADAIRRSIRLSDAAEERLLQFDRELKECGLNPGTSADFTVATLFADRLLAAREMRRRLVAQPASR